MNTTVTTANFYFNDQTRSITDCIKNMKTLLQIPCNLVIYCNNPLYQGIKEIRDEANLSEKTVYNVMDFSSIWSYQFRDKINENRKIYWPTRDPRAGVESHIITNNKFDFVLSTINTNPFKTTKFAWLDANIGVNGSKIAKNFTNEKFINLLDQVGPKFHIQILGVVDKKYVQEQFLKEYYSRYQWIVCGCLFTLENNGKNKTILNRMKEIFVETVNHGYGHAEEMHYLKLLDEFYDDIDKGYGDYSDILENFIVPRGNLNYVLYNIIAKYFQFGYYRECYDACKAFSKNLNDEYFEFFIFYYYSTLMFIGKNEARKILFNFLPKIYSKPYFEQKYLENQNYCNQIFTLVFN